MENQMTVDEQLDRMNEAEFKALLEACAHKTEKTLEQAAMFSQLDRPGKAPEEQLPPLTGTKHSSSLQSLSQSHGSNFRKNSQLHNTSKTGSSSGCSAPSGGAIVGGYHNNNTHYHHTHLNSSFSSNNNHNLINNTNCISTSLPLSSYSGESPNPASYNSQNPHQNVNCVTTIPQNNHSHHLYTPSSYYSSTSSSPSHTEEDTATTSANSSSSSPNNTSYSKTSTAATLPSSRQCLNHSQPIQNLSTNTSSISSSTSSSINVNVNLKRPPPKPQVQNHIEVTATVPSPYYFNSRTADHETDVVESDAVPLGDSDLVVYDASGNPAGNIQLRSEYASVKSLTASSAEFGNSSSYKPHKISPRSSRSGTPVHGDSSAASTRRVGPKKKPKENILSSERLPNITDRYKNIEELVSYIKGEPEKTPSVKKPKKKTKRKETLSKSHSLDENTLGTEVNPSMETRSVSSTLLENKSDEKATGNTTEGLDLSPPSVSKLDSILSHSNAEFITVNRKKTKAFKSGDGQKMKPEMGQKEDSPAKADPFLKPEIVSPSKKELNQPGKLDVNLKDEEVEVPKQEQLLLEESVTKKELVADTDVVTKKEASIKLAVPIPKSEAGPSIPKSEPTQQPVHSREISNPRAENLTRKQDSFGRKQEYLHQRKFSESQRRGDGGRRPDPIRRQDHGRRKEYSREDFSHEPVRRHQYTRHDSEPRNASVSNDQIPKPVSALTSTEPLVEPNDRMIKSEDAVKFCGVNFDNKPDIRIKPNVEFGFGVTDVLSQLATAAPSEAPHAPVDPRTHQVQVTHQPVHDPQSSLSPSVEHTQHQAFPSGDIQIQRNMESAPIQSTKQPPADKESLLGRHPQSVLSPPVQYLPMSVTALPMTGTGYSLSTPSNYYPPMPQQVPMGIMQYYPGPHMQPIQQISAPIMTAIPTQGTGNLQQQQYINPMALTPQQQHQILHHQQILQQQHQNQSSYNSLQHQQLLQYQQIMLKPSTPQQQYVGNQQNMPPFPQSQTAVLPHAQQSYNSQVQGGAYNYHRTSNTPLSNPTGMNCNPQIGSYGIPPQQQQYPPSQQFIGQNQHNFNTQGAPIGHYNNNNYHRSNSRSNQNSHPSNHNYGAPQPSPSSHGPASSGHSNAQHQQHQHTSVNHSQNMRSLPSQVSQPPVTTPPSPDAPHRILADGFMVINSETNPVGQYYTAPLEVDDHVKYARAGQDYMNKYVEKINERVGAGAKIHRL